MTVALATAAVQATAGGLQPLGLEFPLTRNLPGDQVNPSLALGENGGLLVWQDAAIDTHGAVLQRVPCCASARRAWLPDAVAGTRD